MSCVTLTGWHGYDQLRCRRTPRRSRRLAASAAAQAKYDRLFVFGDSYAELTPSDVPASNPLRATSTKGAAENLGISGTLITMSAVGGAAAAPNLAKSSDFLIAPGIPPPANLPQPCRNLGRVD